jgi:hypothetical protein
MGFFDWYRFCLQNATSWCILKEWAGSVSACLLCLLFIRGDDVGVIVELNDADRRVLSHAVAGVMKRPIAARGPGVAFALLQRAVNIDRRQARVGPDGYRNAMPDVLHNERELADQEAQRLKERLEISKVTTRYDLLLGLTGSVSQEEIALLDTVDRTFRAALREHAADLRAQGTTTRDPHVDFQVLWWLAAGRSQRKIAQHFKIAQPLVARIKRTRLQNIYAAVIDQVIPKVTKAAPAGIRDAASANPFGNFDVFEAEQRNFRSYGRESTFDEANKMGHSKNGTK